MIKPTASNVLALHTNKSEAAEPAARDPQGQAPSGHRGDPEAFGDLFARRVRELGLDELECLYSPRTTAVWVYQRHRRALGYSPALLREIKLLEELLQELRPHAGREMRYLVWGSRQSGIFNLGGDLALISDLVQRRDRAGLEAYAEACVDACHGHAINFGLPLISIAMVQGDALGGGFEAVLSADVVVAEQRARFGLPEILFGLFPAMGAYSFLNRRLGRHRTESLILSGRLFSAEEMKTEGIVDEVAEDGTAHASVADYIATTDRRYAAMRAIYSARQQVDPVTHDEMLAIAGQWIEAAMEIEEHNVRRITRLAEAQRRRHESNELQVAITP